MFISNGKSLFGNTGLIIALLILLILTYFSYNKCYLNSLESESRTQNDEFANQLEHFYNITTSNIAPPPSNFLSPTNVRIAIAGSTLTVNFTINNHTTFALPSGFIVVLAQYDINKLNTGNNKFYLSNEYILNSNIPINTNNTLNSQNNLCTIVNGIPVCQYNYTNLDIRDSNGNLYYYKLGISSIYESGNSPFVMPYNINTADKMFTLQQSTAQQNKQYSDFLQYQNSQNNSSNTSAIAYNSTISTADGQYELIKSQLGNYPDNLLLDSQTVNNGTLADLVDKSMAQAIINVNVSTE